MARVGRGLVAPGVLAALVAFATLQTTPDRAQSLYWQTGLLTYLRTTDREHIVLEVNPGDFELVRDSAAELAARLGGISRMEVVSERRVEAGGCVVRTEAGEIDARVSSQLERVRQLLAEAGGATPAAAEPSGA